MLILTRRVGESFIIVPNPGIDPAIPVRELFQTGPIEILVTQVIGARVKVSVVADPRFLILREELCNSPRKS